MLKKVLVLFLVFAVVCPVFAQLTPEEQVKFLTEKYVECTTENLKLQLALNEIELEKEDGANLIAGYIVGGLGVWGIVTFTISGGLYPLVTGCLFVASSYGTLKKTTGKK